MIGLRYSEIIEEERVSTKAYKFAGRKSELCFQIRDFAGESFNQYAGKKGRKPVRRKS